MKRIYTLLTALLLAVLPTLAQESFFEKFADMPGVTSVYISPKMFGLMKSNDIGLHIDSVTGKISSLNILSCENREVADQLRKATAHINPDNGYEELMRIKSEGERVLIYSKERKKDTEYVLLVDDKDEFVIILMCGRLTLEELQGVIK